MALNSIYASSPFGESLNFLLSANIVFLKYDNDNFILYDVVNINKSSLFMELVDLSENYI